MYLTTEVKLRCRQNFQTVAKQVKADTTQVEFEDIAGPLFVLGKFTS